MKALKSLLAIIIIGVCFFFIIRTIIINWHNINLAELNFNFLFLFISVIFYTIHILLCGYIWEITFSSIGEKMPLLTAIKIISLSMGAKYIPGKIWSITSQAWLITKEKIKIDKALFCSILFNILIILSGLILGGNVFPIFYTFILLWIIILHPKILNNIVNFAYRIKKKEGISKLEIKLKYHKILILFFLYIGCWLFLLLGIYFLICSFYTGAKNFLFQLLGVFPIAWVVGFFAFIIPVGLGVREGVLSYLFIKFLYMPPSIGTITAIIIRIWITICEFVFFIISVKNIPKYLKENSSHPI